MQQLGTCALLHAHFPHTVYMVGTGYHGQNKHPYEFHMQEVNGRGISKHMHHEL